MSETISNLDHFCSQKQELDERGRLRCGHPWDSTSWTGRLQDFKIIPPPNPTWARLEDKLDGQGKSNVQYPNDQMRATPVSQGCTMQSCSCSASISGNLYLYIHIDFILYYLIDLGCIRFQRSSQFQWHPIPPIPIHSYHVLQFQAFQRVHLQQATDHVLAKHPRSGDRPRLGAFGPPWLLRRRAAKRPRSCLRRGRILSESM